MCRPASFPSTCATRASPCAQALARTGPSVPSTSILVPSASTLARPLRVRPPSRAPQVLLALLAASRTIRCTARRCGVKERTDEQRLLDKRFVGIALPSFAQLLTEPLAALVDTANIGHLSRDALAGMGVAVAAQYSLTKLFNDPLLRVTTSLVAAAEREERREMLCVVLLLALALGAYQAACLAPAAGAAIRGMGVPSSSSMFPHAVAYLRVRAFGAPLSSLSLAMTGACRGIGDARTPLAASALATTVNVVLDPLLIFGLGWGCAGAAWATVVAQGCGMALMASRLHLGRLRRVRGRIALRALKGLLSTAGVMFARNWGKVGCFALLARAAALRGPLVAGAYSLTFQLGFATSQVAEALATSTQVLLAEALRRRSALGARHVVKRGLQAGLLLSLVLGAITFVLQGPLLALLTNDAPVRATAQGAMLWVLAAQALKAMAYPMNGALMGALDWVFTACALWAAGLAGVGVARLGAAAQGEVAALVALWLGLVAFFGTQLVLGLARIASGRGPWKELKQA